MTKLQLAGLAGLAIQLSHAYPRKPAGGFRLSDLIQRDGLEFVFAAIGDSWGSGVQYSKDTMYDDNSSGCQRLKNGWATIIRDHGQEWGPEGHEPKLCFEACSGRKMENMAEELNKCADQRPKITIMEVGGNDADFYPMADNCIFHKWGYNYGTLYEDDDKDNPKGSCRKSIKQVRENIGYIQGNYTATIDMWRSHRASQGNDASLFTVGYGQFFGMNDECDNWDFQVPLTWFVPNPIFWPKTQRLKKEMREEFNDMVGLVNKAIEDATKSFNDPKIQYIDINPAFKDHRFCEPGHSWWDQLNYSDKVWLWNEPLRYFLALKKGDETVQSWDLKEGQTSDLPSADELAGFDQYNNDETKKDGDEVVGYLRNKDKPDEVLEIRFNPDAGYSTQDSIARTLHPTAEGHNAMGLLMVKTLEQTDWPPPDQNLPPLDPENNKALSIIMEKDGDKFNWIFYETNRGERAGCDTDKTAIFKGPDFSGVDIDKPPNPSGDYNMDVWGRPCKWRGSGDNPGELICDDEHISCQSASSSASTIDCPNTGRKQHEGAFCEFFMEGAEENPTTTVPPPQSTPTVVPKTKALSIVLEEYVHATPPTTMEWIFFATGIGKEASCDKNGATRVKDISGPMDLGGDLGQVDNPPNPQGTFKLNVWGEDCEYRNNNENPGGLFCGDKKYDCMDDPNRGGGDKATKECMEEGGFEMVYHHPVVYCEW